MKDILLILKIASMLPGPLYVGTGLYIAVVGLCYFGGAGDFGTAFKSLTWGLSMALSGIVLFLPNRRINSSRTMTGVGLASLSILLYHASSLILFLTEKKDATGVILIVACLLMGTISFLMYYKEKQKKILTAMAWLIIPLIAGVFGSGNPQWSRFIYMHQAYVAPSWSPNPQYCLRCPEKYTGTWTEWDKQGNVSRVLHYDHGTLIENE